MECILSIVIVTWNTKQLVLECLDSIYGSNDYRTLGSSIEVILIDNNSTDGTPEAIVSLHPHVIYKRNEANIGYAPACNLGMEMATGTYVLLLGSDTRIKSDSLTACIDFLENIPEAGAVSCRLVWPNGDIQGNCKKFPTLLNAVFTYTSLDIFNKDYDMVHFGYDRKAEVDQVATTFLMIQKAVLKEIGHFDPQYRILYNDVDLCKRIWAAGYKIYFIPDAEVIHHGSHSTKKAPAALRKIMYQDIYRYYRNNFGLKAVILIPILFIRYVLIATIK